MKTKQQSRRRRRARVTLHSPRQLSGPASHLPKEPRKRNRELRGEAWHPTITSLNHMELLAEGAGFERARQMPAGIPPGARPNVFGSPEAPREEPFSFTVDDLVSHPLPGYVVPTALAWRCGNMCYMRPNA